MKINESHFGKKMRRKVWTADEWFIPLGFSHHRRSVIGEWGLNYDEAGIAFESHLDDWVPFEEPPKKVIKRMAPALCRSDYNKEIYFLSQNIYESKEKAELDYPKKIIKWPASEALFVEIEVEE